MEFTKNQTEIASLLYERRSIPDAKKAFEFAAEICECCQNECDEMGVDEETAQNLAVFLIRTRQTPLIPDQIIRTMKKTLGRMLPPLEEMTVKELKAFAAAREVDLEDATKKAEIIEILTENL